MPEKLFPEVLDLVRGSREILLPRGHSSSTIIEIQNEVSVGIFTDYLPSQEYVLAVKCPGRKTDNFALP